MQSEKWKAQQLSIMPCTHTHMYLTACDLLKAPQLLLEAFISCCVVQDFGWIAKVIRIWDLHAGHASARQAEFLLVIDI